MTAVCCPLYGDDDGGPSFASDTRPKAKKPYTCCECHETIPAGVTYEKVVGKWDGDLGTFRTCLSCVEIREHFACGRGWIYTELWNQLEDNFFPTMKAGGPCMEGLSPAAKARLFERRLAWMGVATGKEERSDA